ncbi:MAG TPA: preprotein translocase subunit SecY [Dehalococcoidia bacterium]|nr:preprotein translocase subunit SecY [Dehalococcoidia bacterium]
MIDAFSLPDLRGKLLFTLLILIIFRFVAQVPTPGVDREALAKVFENNQLFGMLDLFSGGAMRNLSVLAMGVYPYITATIVMQLLTPVIPQLMALSKEGEAGRNKINMYTHWLAVPLAALQGYGQVIMLQREGVFGEGSIAPLEMAAIILSMVAGTMFLVWLGELITERGIGNGVSIIIFGGIVAGMPNLVARGGLVWDTDKWGILAFAVLGLATILAIVLFTEAARRIPVHYSKSVFRGRRMYRQSGSTHIPLKVNSAGMIPLIFAMSLVMLPGIVASYFPSSGSSPETGSGVAGFLRWWDQGQWDWSYFLLYGLLVVGFAFFYTIVVFEQMNLAETLQKQGGFIPGVRPGPNTSTYLSQVMTRITWAGAIFLALVAVLPYIARKLTGVEVVVLSSTALLIMVGVALDTMKQLEAQLLMRRYEGFLK